MSRRLGWALVLGVVALGAACPSGPARAPAVVTTLPAVPVLARDGAAHTLAEVAAGRPMVVDFFASWCKPCAPQVKVVEGLARSHGPRGLVVVGVAVGESWAEAGPFLDELGATYAAYADPDFALADAAGARSVPALWVIDRAGQVVHRGTDLDAAANAAIERVLAPAPATP